MIFLFLTTENLRSTAFVRELAFHFKPKGRAIVLHGHFGTASDTRFVTKRLSSLLSEELVTNNFMFGDQRQLLRLEEGKLLLRRALMEQSFAQAPVVVMNSLVDGPDALAADPLAVAALVRATFDPEEVFLLPANPKSPLGIARPRIETAADADRLLPVYEEEAAVLNAAARLAPATIAAPSNVLPARGGIPQDPHRSGMPGH